MPDFFLVLNLFSLPYIVRKKVEKSAADEKSLSTKKTVKTEKDVKAVRETKKGDKEGRN